MIHLLDVNILIALLDADHVDHDRCTGWFADHHERGWATCPITENGMLRILGHSRYQGGPETPAGAAALLSELRGWPGHRYWADDISLLVSELVDVSRLTTSRQVTDTYLLALACHNGGRLATLDRRLTTTAVDGGAEALHLIA